MSFIAELKRRNVFRVALAYLVVGWLALQVSDVLVDALELPAVWSRGVLALLLVCFIPVMVFAWIYQLTPEGLKRDDGGSDDDAASTARMTKKLNVAVIVLLMLAIAMMVVNPLGRDGLPPVDPAGQAPERSMTANDVARNTGKTGKTGPSVAVLAFENMSPNAENAYFAEGISEEILNLLAKIEGLQVASRTSAFSFSGTDTPIPLIAEQLDVASILEGSVRRQGNRVRITAQLIDAQTDKHLWSDTFDRQLDDIFAVQEEIARAIASELESTLGVSGIRRDAPTENMQAYELFLRGRQLFYQRGEALAQGLNDLRAAVDKDPEFSEAWAYLAATAATIPGYSNFTTEEQAEIEGEARRAAERALALDPGSGLAVAILGNLEPDLLKSHELRDRAVELAPKDSGLIMWAATFRLQTGVYREEALAMMERAYRLDPLVGINNGMLGIAYLSNGQFELGQRHVRRAQELGWDYVGPSLLIARLARGDAEAVLEETDGLIASQGADWPEAFRVQVNTNREVIAGNMGAEEVFQLEQSLRSQGDTPDFRLAYLLLGQYDRYFDTWEEFIDRGASELYHFRSIYIPGGRDIVEHPRFLKISERFGLIAFWEVHGYPMGCQRLEGDERAWLHCPDWPE